MTKRTTDRAANDDGFSLLELIAMMALVALAVSIVVPRFSGSRQAMTLRATALELVAGLKDARSAARASNSGSVLQIDTATRIYSAAGAVKPKTIPRSVALTFEAKSAVSMGAARAGFQFRPDGTASGGRITLRSGPDTATITVDWLTSAVQLDWR